MADKRAAEDATDPEQPRKKSRFDSNGTAEAKQNGASESAVSDKLGALEKAKKLLEAKKTLQDKLSKLKQVRLLKARKSPGMTLSSLFSGQLRGTVAIEFWFGLSDNLIMSPAPMLGLRGRPCACASPDGPSPFKNEVKVSEMVFTLARPISCGWSVIVNRRSGCFVDTLT